METHHETKIGGHFFFPISLGLHSIKIMFLDRQIPNKMVLKPNN